MTRRRVQGVHQFLHLLLHLLEMPRLHGRVLVHIQAHQVIELVLQAVLQVGDAAVHGGERHLAAFEPVQHREGRGLVVLAIPPQARGVRTLQALSHTLGLLLTTLHLIHAGVAQVFEPRQAQGGGHRLLVSTAAPQTFHVHVEVPQGAARLGGEQLQPPLELRHLPVEDRGVALDDLHELLPGLQMLLFHLPSLPVHALGEVVHRQLLGLQHLARRLLLGLQAPLLEALGQTLAQLLMILLQLFGRLCRTLCRLRRLLGRPGGALRRLGDGGLVAVQLALQRLHGALQVLTAVLQNAHTPRLLVQAGSVLLEAQRHLGLEVLHGAHQPLLVASQLAPSALLRLLHGALHLRQLRLR
mmetsp:Transcript_55204/g.131790  ORF Transcript_55204/g.131790 Transcript_55204/m.131790 type:complete len:356 (-) Transcript_55204:1152-2219(-)